MKRRYISVLILFLLFFMPSAFSESQGELLFKQNRPDEAIPLLEDEISLGTASAQAYNFLGLAYYQTGEYQKSVDVFDKGLKTSGTNKKVLAFNQGNSYYLLQNYEGAVKSFSLTLSADPTYTNAILNRGNAYLMLKDFKSAVKDYEDYLRLETQSEQKDVILQLIALLKKEIVRQEEEERIAAIEAERIAEEERKMQEEMERQRLEQERIAEEERKERERIAEEERKERERLEEEARIAKEKEEAEKKRIEEEKRAAEAERRRKLLEEVANSLQDTNSTNMTAGSEDLMDYDFESELD